MSASSFLSCRSGFKYAVYELDKEDCYAFLDSKPEVDRRRGGKKKGRRNNREILINRNNLRHSYLKKTIVSCNNNNTNSVAAIIGECGDCTTTGTEYEKNVGKKRRMRLLSDHMQDFNVGVPYSLNRKNRWREIEDSSNGCFKAISETANTITRDDNRVKISAIESYYNLKGDQNQVTTYHEFDSNGVLIWRKNARNSRGALLKSLTNQCNNENDDTENPMDINIQYNFIKPHSSAKVMGISFRGMRKWMKKSVKHVIYDELPSQEEDIQESIVPLNEFENCEQWIPSIYRAPSRRLFTLADFVVETALPSVTLRRNKLSESAKDDVENQYVITDSVELDDSLSDKLDYINTDDETNPAQFDICHISNNLPQVTAQIQKRYAEFGSSIFEMNLHPSTININSLDKWQKYVDFCLLNNNTTQLNNSRIWAQNKFRLIFDVSLLFIEYSNCNYKKYISGEPILIFIITYTLGNVNVVSNGAFNNKLEKNFENLFYDNLKRSNFSSLTAFIKSLVHFFAKLDTVFYRDLKKSKINECQKSIYNSQRLYTLAQTIQVNDIVKKNRAEINDKQNNSGNQFEIVNSYFTKKNDENKYNKEAKIKNNEFDEDEDDFEHIDINDEFECSEAEDDHEKMENFVVNKISVNKKQIKNLLNVSCGNCGVNTEENILEIDCCGHKFCTSCIAVEFKQRARFNNMSLNCLNKNCNSELALDILQTLIPLPIASQFAITNFVENEIAQNNLKLFTECKSCFALLSSNKTENLYNFQCSECGISFCCHCKKEPHWPLNCEQNQIWKAKFQQQNQLNAERLCSELESQELSEQKKTSNAIAHRFSTICCESRARRMDVNTTYKLIKNVCHIGRSQIGNAFCETRKSALYMLEFGFAWLYMNRVNSNLVPPLIHSKFRVLLNVLRNKVDNFDNELLFAGSLTEKKEIIENIKEFSELVDNVIAKAKLISGINLALITDNN